MKELNRTVKDINAQVCSVNGLLQGYCKDSMQGNKKKNYLLLIGVSLFVQYVLPVLVVFLIIPLVIGNVLAFGVITFVSIINPFFMLALIPLLAADVGIIAAIVIASFIITIVYWLYYFKEIGVLAFVPILAWVFSFILGFVPYIGNFLSAVISITPWMALMAAYHWFLYRNDGRSNIK